VFELNSYHPANELPAVVLAAIVDDLSLDEEVLKNSGELHVAENTLNVIISDKNKI